MIPRQTSPHQQKLEALQVKYSNFVALHRDVRVKLNHAQRVIAEGKAVGVALHHSEDAPVYKGVGKAFILCESAEVLELAQKAVDVATDDIKKFTKQEKYLSDQTKACQIELKELMEQRRTK